MKPTRRHGRRPAHGRRLSLLLALAAAVFLGVGCDAEPGGDPVQVRVPPGASFSAVADSLAARDVIGWPTLFRAYARLRGVDREIKAGTYAFRPGTPWSAILDDLRVGRVLTARVVIPEGWDLRRIAPRLATFTGLDADSVAAVLADSSTAARLGVAGPTLEGYLFPATYTIPLDTELETILERMTHAYQAQWTPERRARADSLGLSEHEVVTLASIIERETRRPEEMPLVSAVFHNRLRIGLPLQADATVQYALGEHQTRLLYAHIDAVADDPYNTYRHAGLPPGPIGAPGARALDAALEPADVRYLYFVARVDGSHIFTRTLAEHNRARAAVRREWDAYWQEQRRAERAGTTPAGSPPPR